MILLAFDDGPAVGLGHRRRMEALAAALAAGGCPPALCRLGEEPVEGDVVVVDSYRTRADAESIRARTTVAVDELGRDLAVDLLVDPAPGTPTPAPRARHALRGLRYALVDPALGSRTRAPGLHDEVASVLVTTGGTDAAGAGAAVAGALCAALPDARVRVVVGPWSASQVPEGVEAIRGRAGLAGELEAADLVVSAAGVTLLEALALGRPVVAFALAGTQRRYLDGLAAAGAIVATAAHDAAEAAARLAADPDRRRKLAATGRGLVDGRGSHRVASAVADLV